MQNEFSEQTVRSLWLPLQGMNLVVPNVAVIEVIGYQPYALVDSEEEWMLGSLRWRGKYLPVISIESLCGVGSPAAIDAAANTSRLAVFNTVRQNSCLDFYAVVTADIPRLMHINEGRLDTVEETVDSEAIVCEVSDGQAQAMIPDMEVIQDSVERVWESLV
ncbi:MAG: chemotaxis protein CheW [Gammaproteobacteria bacterium]